jgi:putative acetyltransferase
MLFRDERPGDEEAIHELTSAAFETMPFSSGTEAPIIKALRDDGDLALSLVAVDEGKIVGHVAFSAVTIDGKHEGWFGLGPISVLPLRQRRGIGKALIGKGLDILRQRGARGCALIGDPGYYGRLDFKSSGQLLYGDLDSRYVQHIVFWGPEPHGRLGYARAFELH